MPNSDNAYGTYNKKTQILSQSLNGVDGGYPNAGWDDAETTFSSVDEAKSWFLTDEAIAVFNECCTELQWSVVDNTKLKYTMAFGTKGGDISESDDWAGLYKSRSQALIDSNGWAKPQSGKYRAFAVEDSTDHLF